MMFLSRFRVSLPDFCWRRDAGALEGGKLMAKAVHRLSHPWPIPTSVVLGKLYQVIGVLRSLRGLGRGNKPWVVVRV